ncbi:MAG: DUF6194 family protein [Planctomycetota bacterium]
MTPPQIVQQLCRRFDGIVPKERWGETSLFYNPASALPHGVYFCTLKTQDGDHDRSSNLNRPGVFRLALGIGPDGYTERFGPRPPRPAKGQAVDTGHDFTRLDRLMPHPVYAWMGWVQILSPSESMWDETGPLITMAYERAVEKFVHQQKSKRKPPR